MENFTQTIPFWQYFRRGDSIVYVTLTLVGIETSFSYYGLVNLFPPSQQTFFVKIILFVAAALTSSVNLIIAWSNALNELQWEEEVKEIQRQERQDQENRLMDDLYNKQRQAYWDKQEKIEREKQEISEEQGEIASKLKGIKGMISIQEETLNKLDRNATFAHRRWWNRVKRWWNENSDKIEAYRKNYLVIEANDTTSLENTSYNNGNGYHSAANDILPLLSNNDSNQDKAK